MITRISRIAAGAALLLFALSGSVFAHDATGVTAKIDCSGTYTVSVGYELFSDGHRLVTTLVVDGVTSVKTETPTGAGTVTYTGKATSTVEVTVTTPDDDNAPLTASAKAPTDCATPPPSHAPKPTPLPSPPPTSTINGHPGDATLAMLADLVAVPFFIALSIGLFVSMFRRGAR